MKKRKKKLIVFLSVLSTLVIAVTLFCLITGFNLKTFIFGTKSTGSTVVENTTLQTTVKPLPTDGSKASDHNAIDNFAYLAYKIDHSNFETTVKGVAKANYNGMNVDQSVDDYRMVTKDYAYVDTRSVSTFVKVYSETFYTKDKVFVKEGTNANYDSFDVEGRSRAYQQALYGYGPEKIVGYIVCDETIINKPEVINNGDGTYTSVYQLDPKVSPFYYQRKVKYNADIADYPLFNSIELTVTYNDSWEVQTIVYNELYEIYKMKSWIKTNNIITENFNFLPDDTQIKKYDIYKEYFDMEVKDIEDGEELPAFELGSLDYIGTMANLITGRYMNLDLNLLYDGKNIPLFVSVDLLTFETQINVENSTFIYKNNNLYIKSSNGNSYVDSKDIEPLIILIYEIKNSYNTKPQSISSKENISLESFNTDDFISQIMSDISSGKVTKNDSFTKVDVVLHLGSIELPVYFNFYTPDDETIEFENLGTIYNINGKPALLDIAITTEEREFIKIDDTYKKINMAVSSNLSFDVEYQNTTYNVVGDLFIDIYNINIKFDGLLKTNDKSMNLEIIMNEDNTYISINGIKLKLSSDELIGLISYLANYLYSNENKNSVVNSNSDIINKDIVIAYLEKLSFELNEEVKIKYDDELIYNNIIIKNIILSIAPAIYEKIIITDEEKYLTVDNIYSIVNFIFDFDINNICTEFDFNINYDDLILNVFGNYYPNNNYLDFNIKYGDIVVSFKYYEDYIYISYLDFKYYININDYLDYLPNLTLDDFDFNEFDVNNTIRLVFIVLNNLGIVNENGNILVSYDNKSMIISVIDNIMNISISNINCNNVLSFNGNVAIYSNETLNTPVLEEYNELSLVNEFSLKSQITYNEKQVIINANGYINLLSQEVKLNAKVDVINRIIDFELIVKDNYLYINFDEIYLSINLKTITLPNNSNSFDALSIIKALYLFEFTAGDGLNISLKEHIEVSGLEINELSINLKASSQKDIIVENNKYIDLSTLEALFDSIGNIINSCSIEISTTLSYKYNNKLYDLNIFGFIYYEKNKVSCNLNIKVNDELINVIYDNNNLYLSYKDIKLKLNIEELMALNESQSEINIPSLDIDKINVVLSLLDKLHITNNNGIDIKLESIIESLSEINIKITNSENNLIIDLKEFNYKDICCEGLNVILTNDYEKLTYDENLYVELGLVNEITGSLKVIYNEEEITVDILGYVDIKELEAKLNIKLTQKDNTIDLEVIYRDNILYVSLNDINIAYEINNKARISQNKEIDYKMILAILLNLDVNTKEKLNISYKEEINIDSIRIKDINLSLISCDKRDINVEDKYVTVDDILEIIELVEILISDNLSIEISTTLSYKYNNKLYDLNIFGFIYYEKNKVSCNLNIKVNDELINVIYDNNNLYLSYKDIKLKLNIEELMALNESQSEINIPSLDIDKINVVLSLLDKLHITNNNGIDIKLESIIESLSEINIKITNSENNLIIDLKEFNYKDICCEGLNVILTNDYEKLTYDENLYVELGLYLDLHIYTELLYDILDIKFEGDVYVDLANQIVSLESQISINNNIISLSVVYKDEVVYITLDDIKLFINISSALEIEFPDANPTFDISFIKNIVIETIGCICIRLDYVDFDGIVLKNTSIDISKSMYKEFVFNKDEYTNDASVLINNALDIYDVIKSILSYKKVSLNINACYENINISGNLLIDFNDVIKVKALINVCYDSYNFEFDIIYKDNLIYLKYNDIKLVLSIEQVMDFISEYMQNDNNTEIDYSSIINKVDLAKILVMLIVSDNETILELNLSDYINDFISVIIKITSNDDVVVDINKFDLNISLKPTNDNIVINPNDYTDLTNYLDIVNYLINIFNNKSVGIEFEEVNVTMGSDIITINGLLDIFFDSDIRVSSNLEILYNDMAINVRLLYVNNIIYITVSNQTLVVDITEVLSFADELTNRINEILNNNTTSNKETKNVLNDANIDIILDIINTLVIKENSLSVSLDSLVNSLLKITMVFALDNDLLDLNISGNYDDILFDGNIFASDIHSLDFEIPTSNLITTNDLISVLDYVEAILKLKDKKEFNVYLNTTIVENGHINAIISGNVMVLINGKEFSSKLNLEIIEYKNNVKSAWHQLEVIVIYEKSSQTPIMYATYGNNETDKNAVVKAYSTISGLIDLLDSLKKITGLDILDSVGSSNKSTSININKLIKQLVINNEMINLIIDQSAYNSLLENEALFSILLSMNNSSISSIELDGLYVSYTNPREYMMLKDTDIILSDVSVGQIVAPSDLTGYYDISNISYLTDSLVNVALQQNFEITGTVTLSALGINVNVPVTISIVTNDSGIPAVHVNINMSKISSLVSILASKKVLDIYYIDGYVYIHRKDNSGDEYKLKVHIDTFLDDIVYYLLDYGLGLSDTIIDQINNSSSPGDGFIDAAKCVNSASIGTNEFSFSLNMVEIADNTSLGDLDVTILSKEVFDGKNIVPMITNITNFNFNMVSVINLKSSDLTLSNVMPDDNGILVVNKVDMSNLYNYVDDFNKNFKVDEKYELSNDSWVSTGKIGHSVIFDMAGIVDNITLQYIEGAYISFPTYKDDIIKVETDGVVKYYKLLGWYSNKKYTSKINDTSSVIMGGKKLYFYAKLKDVTTHITIKSAYHDDYIITTYEGASIEKEVSSKYGVIKNDNTVIKYNGMYKDEVLFDVSNVLYGDYTITVSWDEVTYPFVVIFGDNRYEISTDSKDPILPRNALILIDGIYYEYEASYLTPDILLSVFSKYFVINDDSKALELVLIDPNYQDEVFNKDMKNYIKYNILSNNFDSYDYIGFYLPKVEYDITKLIPSSTYNNYYINAWKDVSGNYYSLNDLKEINSNLNLTAYISSVQSDFVFELDNDTAIISGYNGTSQTVIIPRYALVGSEYYVVTSIKTFTGKDEDNKTIIYSPFTSNDTVINVVFNDGFTTVGNNAFKNCKNIRNIYFSDTVNSVISDAFYMDYSSTFETVRDDTCKHVRFYTSENSKLNKSKWLAAKWNSNSDYYGDKGSGFLGMNKYDFTNSFQTFDGDIVSISNNLV